ncbi:hypothetical protein EJ06DRAFT_133766 [Trichodelitschia bisporula]|uniref:AB hydrolase-1 domain-containing protein n=1 Tax=Trichodelitschia bisporula TaxID=703511 RepID=A0A6G1HP73_9PEZI|nr:hypothetical protein EJ06DRAFT_133766 [Trichodelitschia bisporula]
MKKTLLLVFIHGFKGGDDTFAHFPSHLRALLSHALPHIDIVQVQYPAFETKGDLQECVARFKEWLQNKVIDLEVANHTPSPTVDPGVRTVLIGHSMGGIVAAETILSITTDPPVSPFPSTADLPPTFPSIAALLTFDTPFLGIAPGVVAHGAEGHWNSAYTAYTSVAGVLGWNNSSPAPAPKKEQKLLTSAAAAAAAAETPDADAAATPAWTRWGRYAMFAGAAGAVAAGGAAAYMKREQLSAGWQWVGGHLEFVGCLARGEELRARLNSIMSLTDAGLGFANVYTTLGAAVEGKSGWYTGVTGAERTFCLLPTGDNQRKCWVPAENGRATAETGAHCGMFAPRENPGYYAMSEMAKGLVVGWVEGSEWYESADTEAGAEEEDDVEVVETPEVEVDFEMDFEAARKA